MQRMSRPMVDHLPIQQLSDQSGAGPSTGDDLRRYLGVFTRNGFLLAGVIILALVAGYFLAHKIAPKYTATSTVMLSTRQTNVIDTQSVLSGISTDVGAVSAELQLLQSSELLRRVVQQLHLHEDPEFVRIEKADAPDPGWVRIALDAAREAFDAAKESARSLLGIEYIELPRADVGPDFDTMTAVWNLQGRLRVRTLGDWAPVMAISVESGTSDKAVLLANAIAEVYIDDQLEAKFEATQRATAWLSQRLPDLKQKLEQSEAAVAAFRARISEGEGPGLELSDDQMSELSRQLIQARAARAEAEAQLQHLQEQASAATPNAGGLANPRLIEDLRNQRKDLLAQQESLVRQYGAGSPEVHAVNNQIIELDRTIASNVRNAVDEVRLQRDVVTAQSALDVARAREAALDRSLKSLQTGTSEQSKEALKLNELQREAEANRLVYENFLTRFKEIAQQADIQQADARLISPASEAAFTGTSTAKVLLATGLFGLVIGAALVLLLERLNDTFKSEAELEEALKITVLSAIPRLKGRANRKDVLQHVQRRANSAIAEAIRKFRTSLTLSSIDVPARIVMVTSSISEEGKSTSSLLLAYASVRAGRAAIVVDCDLRRPTLRSSFNLAAGPDLLSVLDGSATVEDVVHVDEKSGIAVLPISKAVPQAADVLSSRLFRHLIEGLAERYDLVVLDVPPILLVSDAGVIGNLADATVYAVRWGRTPRQLVKKGLKQLQTYGIKVNGLLLTGVDPKAAAQYEAYRYGYSEYRNKYYTT